MKCVVILLVLLVLLAGCISTDENGHDEDVPDSEITPHDLNELGEVELKMIDTRPHADFAEGHIPGAISIPLEKLSLSEIRARGIFKTDKIVVYASSGQKSQVGYNILNSFGFETKSLAGGFAHWRDENYPVEAGEPIEAPPTKEESAGGPRIFAPVKKHDLGIVPQYGGVATHNFTIENTGKEALEIGTITTSCACTSAKIDKKTISPGDKAVLTVIFDPDVHAEPLERFSRTIFIESNDPATPELQLRIFVDIDEGK
ncbi:MAG: DUF1573 domain-containing protein [Candidatus Hydrothermarchaeaceae archaeon]